MPNNNGSGVETLSPLLVILVAGSISLAIVNKANHPAYFDIVKIAIAYTWISHKREIQRVWEVWEVWEDGEEVLPPILPTLPTLPTLLFP